VKVIVVYASYGAGHLRCAQAIFSSLKAHNRQVEASLVDILETSTWGYRVLYKFGYGLLIRYLTPVWQFLFYLNNIKSQNNFSRRITSFANYLNTRNFQKFLIRGNPDYVISTHFLSSEITAGLKNIRAITSKLVTVITDFGVHPFWASSGTDKYIVSSTYTKRQLLGLGAEEEKIYDFGIPIDEKFYIRHGRDSLCQKLGIKNSFTALLMTGSFGLGPLEEIVQALHQDTQVLIVCARNKKVYQRLKEKNLANTKVFGFISNADELMSVSDVIITKPGGLSICESLAKDLFPVFISPIPGQETENIKALASYGIGVYPKKICKIKDIIMDLKNHPEHLFKAKSSIASLQKPDCLKNISDVIR